MRRVNGVCIRLSREARVLVVEEDKRQDKGNGKAQNAANRAPNHAVIGICNRTGGVHANKRNQGHKGGRAAHGEAFYIGQTSQQAGDARAADRRDHGFHKAQVNAVHRRFRNAGDSRGDTAGDAFGAGLFVFRFRRNAERRAALCDIGAEHRDENDHVIAERGKVGEEQGHQGIVHTGHDDERHSRRQQANRQPGDIAIQERRDRRQNLSHDSTEGA